MVWAVLVLLLFQEIGMGKLVDMTCRFRHLRMELLSFIISAIDLSHS